MLAWVALAFGGPLYNADELHFDTGKTPTSEFRARVRRHVRQGLELRTPDGAAVAVESLERPALKGVILALQPQAPEDMEFDLLFADEEGVHKPVMTVRSGNRVVVEQGDAGFVVPEVAPESVQQRFSLPALRHHRTRFEPDVLGTLEQALSMLTPAERARISDVDWVRHGGGHKSADHHPAGWVNTASYLADGDGGRVEIYDEAMETHGRFVGPVDAPLHPNVLVLLHEISHAISDAAHRQAMVEYERLRVAFNRDNQRFNQERERFNKAVNAHNANPTTASAAALASQRTALDALQRELTARNGDLASRNRALDGLTGTTPAGEAYAAEVGTAVTVYAQAGPEEALADAFALYKCDRAALARIDPSAVAWFDAGRHLR